MNGRSGQASARDAWPDFILGVAFLHKFRVCAGADQRVCMVDWEMQFLSDLVSSFAGDQHIGNRAYRR